MGKYSRTTLQTHPEACTERVVFTGIKLRSHRQTRASVLCFPSTLAPCLDHLKRYRERHPIADLRAIFVGASRENGDFRMEKLPTSTVRNCYVSAPTETGIKNRETFEYRFVDKEKEVVPIEREKAERVIFNSARGCPRFATSVSSGNLLSNYREAAGIAYAARNYTTVRSAASF